MTPVSTQDITVTRMAGGCGAIVEGIDLAQGCDDATFAVIDRALLDLPPLQPAREGVAVASPWSPGGTDSWAQLLTGALAAYRLHEQLTGEDIRPTNRDYRITPGR